MITAFPQKRGGFFKKERRRFDAGMDAMDSGTRLSDIRFVLFDAPRGRQTCCDPRCAGYIEIALISQSCDFCMHSADCFRVPVRL